MYTQFSLIFFERRSQSDCVHEQAASELRISALKLENFVFIDKKILE